MFGIFFLNMFGNILSRKKHVSTKPQQETHQQRETHQENCELIN